MEEMSLAEYAKHKGFKNTKEMCEKLEMDRTTVWRWFSDYGGAKRRTILKRINEVKPRRKY